MSVSRTLVRPVPLLVIALASCHASAPPPQRQVVFVCEHGAAKSVVATAYFNKLAAERGLAVHAIARGTDPQDAPSVTATRGLQSDGLAPSADNPRRATGAELRTAARIIALDCQEPGMTAMRGMDACWNDVPATSAGYPAARDAIRAHVATLVDELAREP